LKHNAIGCIRTDDGITMTWGQNLCKKKYVDPYNEEVTFVVNAKTQEEFKELIRKELGIAIDFPLYAQAKDFVGFTDEENKD